MWGKNKNEVIADHIPHSGYTCSNSFIFFDISHGQGTCSFFISIRRCNYFIHEKKKMEPIKHLLSLLRTLVHSFHKYLWSAWSVRVIILGRPPIWGYSNKQLGIILLLWSFLGRTHLDQTGAILVFVDGHPDSLVSGCLVVVVWFFVILCLLWGRWRNRYSFTHCLGKLRRINERDKRHIN